MNVEETISSRLAGRQLLSVVRSEHNWDFQFADGGKLRAECPWRIVSDGRIAFGNYDQGRKLGGPKPLDGVEESERYLIGQSVQHIRLRQDTSDLTVSFGDGRLLELLPDSCLYEAWQFASPGLSIVAAGGREPMVFSGAGTLNVKIKGLVGREE